MLVRVHDESGTMLGVGKLLAGGRGILVPWRDPQAIAREVVGLLSDDAKRLALRKRAAAYGHGMAWPVVARRYAQSFERAHARGRGRFQPRDGRAPTATARPARMTVRATQDRSTGDMQALGGQDRVGNATTTPQNHTR